MARAARGATVIAAMIVARADPEATLVAAMIVARADPEATLVGEEHLRKVRQESAQATTMPP